MGVEQMYSGLEGLDVDRATQLAYDVTEAAEQLASGLARAAQVVANDKAMPYRSKCAKLVHLRNLARFTRMALVQGGLLANVD